jgi:O-methyltransferase
LIPFVRLYRSSGLRELQTSLTQTAKLGRLALRSPVTVSTIAKVTHRNLTFLETAALVDLAEAAIAVERRRLDGVFVEAGCALGGSAIVLARAKRKERSLFIYDVFGMIPAPSDNDGEDVHERYRVIKDGQAVGTGGDRYYGYRDDLYETVHRTFEQFALDPAACRIHLVKGQFEDVLNIKQPVALAHLDCDWYDSVMTCLERIEPCLVRGGMLIVDDYHSWSGCKRAVNDYFSQAGKNQYEFITKSRLHIVKR